MSPARDAVQFQKWVLSRHKAIRIVPARLFLFFSGFIETQIPDGVHSAHYLVEISPFPLLSDFVFFSTPARFKSSLPGRTPPKCL